MAFKVPKGRKSSMTPFNMNCNRQFCMVLAVMAVQREIYLNEMFERRREKK